jgi:hypothetical protein
MMGSSSDSIEQRIRRCLLHEVNRNDALTAQSFYQLWGDCLSVEFVYFILDRDREFAFVGIICSSSLFKSSMA